MAPLTTAEVPMLIWFWAPVGGRVTSPTDASSVARSVAWRMASSSVKMASGRILADGKRASNDAWGVTE